MWLDPEWILRFQTIIIYIWSLQAVRILVAHSGLNWAAAVMVSVRTGEFQLGKVGEVFWRKVLPIAFFYFVARIAGGVVFGEWLPAAVFASLELLLWQDLLDSLSQVPELQPVFDAIPEPLRSMIKKPG